MSIKLKSLILLLITALVPLLILGLISYRISSNSLAHSIKSQLSKALEDADKSSAFYFSEREKFLQKLAGNDDFLLWLQNRNSGKNVRFLYELFTASFKYEISKSGISKGLEVYEGDSRVLSLMPNGLPMDISRASKVYFGAGYYSIKSQAAGANIFLFETVDRLTAVLKSIHLQGSNSFRAFIFSPSTETLLGEPAASKEKKRLKTEIAQGNRDFFIKISGNDYRIFGKLHGSYFIGVSISKAEYLKPIKRLQSAILLILLLTVIIVLIIAFIVSNVLTSPILEITSVSEKIADGNYDEPVRIDRKDELGRLSKSFDNMRRKVKSTVQTMDEQLKDLSVLYDVSKNISKQSDLMDIVSLIIETIHLGFGVKRLAMLLKEYDGDVFSIAAQQGLDEETILNLRVEGKFVREFITSNESVQKDRGDLGRIQAFFSKDLIESTDRLLVIPMLSSEQIVGIILLFDYDEKYAKYFRILASLLSPTIYISTLNSELTAVTKHAFDVVSLRITQAIAESDKYKMHTTFAKMRIEDESMLTECDKITAEIYGELEAVDRIYRIAYYEIIIIFSGKDKESAKQILSKIISDNALNISYITATFPEDGASERKILSKLKV